MVIVYKGFPLLRTFILYISAFRGRRDDRERRGRDSDEEEEILMFQKSEKNSVTGKYRAEDKKEYLMIIKGSFFLFLIETICCGPMSELSL